MENWAYYQGYYFTAQLLNFLSQKPQRLMFGFVSSPCRFQTTQTPVWEGEPRPSNEWFRLNWVSPSKCNFKERAETWRVWIWTQVKGILSPSKRRPIFHWHEKDNVYGFLLAACVLPKGYVVEEGDIWTTYFAFEEKIVHSSVQQFFTLS